MTWLTYLNPLSSLFGRIFLWFWLSTIVMIVATAFATRQLSEDFKLEEATTVQVEELGEIANRLARVANFPLIVGPERMRRFIRNSRLVGNRLVILFNPDSMEIVTNRRLPRPMRSSDLLPLALAGKPSQMSTPSHTFFGAYMVNLAGSEFFLILGEPKLFQSPIERLRAQDPSIRMATAIIVSGTFCFLLAWSLVRPIRKLQNASRELATGNTKAQVLADNRSDELGQLAKDFNEMATRIDQLLDAQKRLLGDISHELRTPLTRLQLAVGLAQDANEEDLPKHLARIEKEGARIDAMIAQVLQLSRLEAQPERIQMQDINLVSLLEKVVDDAKYEATAAEKRILFKSNVSSLAVKLDPQLIASALENLVRNAIKYSAERSEVSIILETQQNWILIKVNDQGDGVPESELANLFRPFYRVSLARQRQTGGTGLGLAIAERAVKVHGGEIFAENLAEGGLSVTIRLPNQQTSQ